MEVASDVWLNIVLAMLISAITAYWYFCQAQPAQDRKTHPPAAEVPAKKNDGSCDRFR